jgi:predicted Zn-dependent peptidase
MTLESPIARAGQMARHILVHGRPLGLEEMRADVERVTADDIARVAARIIASAPTIAAVGPVGALPEALDIGPAAADRRVAVG